jgi:hypothetical protein
MMGSARRNSCPSVPIFSQKEDVGLMSLTRAKWQRDFGRIRSLDFGIFAYLLEKWVQT